MMAIDLTSIFFVLVVSTTAVQSQMIKGPTNALKRVSDNVTLECVTGSSNCDQVEWTKMEGAQSPKTVYRDGSILNGFKERYSVNSTGGCSLTITQLKISDSGRFSCVLTMDASQETRSSILFVINVNESCQSNLLNNTLNQNDVYSFSTVINVPAKSVEPSNVTLYFLNKTADERETMEDSQTLTVKTTLIGKAGKKNTTQHVCRVSLSPNTANDFDRTTATLDICTTQELIVSYPVQNITVSSPDPYYKGDRVTCTAEGYPHPEFKWTRLKTGVVVDGDTLVIKGEAGDKYNCTATNIIDGKPTSQSRTIEVFSPPPPPDQDTGCGPGCCAVIVIVLIFIILMVIWSVGWKLGWWPLWFCFPGFLKKDGDITGLCCKCCTCFSISFCAISKYCKYFACCVESVDNKERAKADGESAEPPLTEVVSNGPAEPLTNSTPAVPEKPLTEAEDSSKTAEPLTNSTTPVSAEPLTNSTAAVPEKPLTEVVESSKTAEPLTNSTAAVPEKPLTEVVESSKTAEPLTNSTTTGPQKPPRVSDLAPMDLILTSQTEARTSGQ